MRTGRVWMMTVPAVIAGAVFSCGDDPEIPREPKFGESSVEDLVAAMTLEEKVDQMHGLSVAPVDDLFYTPENERLAIPSLKMVDGPRGVRAGKATAFPVAMARGATWDPALEERIGEAIGDETAAKGANVLLAPTMNILRHPAWGRAQETYGEDTTLIGKMAVAFIRGAQMHVMACAKHFAANSIEDTRFDVDVTVDERSLREVYLPHFEEAVVEGDVASVMSAYNSVNGAFASENPHLLRDVLKGDWGFEGFVMSDWIFGTRSTAPAANAGLDIEMPSSVYFGFGLVTAVEEGEVPESAIDEAVTRILTRKMEYASKLTPEVDPSRVETAEHLELAYDAAVESMVLLKNGAATLPLDTSSGSTIAVVGELAAVANLGDLGSSSVTPSSAVTPLQGIEAAAPGGSTVTHIAGPTLSPADLETLASAEVAVVVVGLTSDDEGEGLITEGGDRETLSLSEADEALILQVAGAAPKTIVVLEAGSAIVVRPWIDGIDALLMAWYPGMEGGRAIGDVLFGAAAPGGRLPITFPRDEADLPPFDHDSLEVEYGYLHGYRWVDDLELEPEFPFGFGLGYTTFTFDGMEVDDSAISDGLVTVSVEVTNTGDRQGDAVVQAYVRAEQSAVPRAPRDLRGFSRVQISPGEQKTVTLELRTDDVGFWSEDEQGFVVEPGRYIVEVGPSSRELPLSSGFDIP